MVRFVTSSETILGLGCWSCAGYWLTVYMSLVAFRSCRLRLPRHIYVGSRKVVTPGRRPSIRAFPDLCPLEGDH
jgi:hypothetical protein